uniref:Right handed beta helix domain-containing protein n=1 Tax=Fervidobacterium pennivorans TaxID=93466 RepID=A0A7C4W6C7_FERPE
MRKVVKRLFKEARFVQLVALLILIIPVVIVTAGVLVPQKLGIAKVELGKELKVDGKNFPFTFLDGMLLVDGKRTITMNGQKYIVEVKTSPDQIRLNGITEVYTYVFESTVTFYDPTVRALKAINKSNEIKLSDKFYLAVASDDFGNISDVAFVPPTLENLDILDSQNPITNISGRKFLLSSKSPYRIISKTLLPEKSALMLESGVTVITALNAELNIKGAFVTTGLVSFLGSGKLTVSDSGSAYVSAIGPEIDISSDRGSLIFVDGSNLRNIDANLTNFVVIRKSSLNRVSINGVHTVYIIDSSIEELEIQNCGNVFINNTVVNDVKVGLVSKVISYDSRFDKLSISDLSSVALVSSKITNLQLSKGSVLKVKNSTLMNAKVEDYSIAYIFKTNVNQLSVGNAKYYQLESNIKKLTKLQEE